VSDSTVTFLILGAAVLVFVWDHLPVAIVALGVALALWATGVLELEQALAGFGDPSVLFIAALFVVSEALDATGVTAWVGQWLTLGAGESRARLLVATMVLCALLTALITPNGSVAALIPVVVVTAVRLGRRPSELLLPLAFSSMAGSLLVLSASPVNVVVSEAASDAGVGRFGFFSFALVGVPLLLGTIVVVLLLGDRLVPRRTPKSTTPDFSRHARTLALQYDLDESGRPRLGRREGAVEVVVPPRSELVGDVVYPGLVSDNGDFVVVAVQRRGEDQEGETELAVGDTMLLRGRWGVLEERVEAPDLIAVDDPAAVRRQAVPLGPGAGRTAAVLAGMIGLLASGVVPPAVAGLLAAMAIVVSGVVTIEQAYRGIQWTTVILVAGMIPLSTAMTQTGAATTLAEGIVDLVGEASPRLLVLGLVLLTFVLGQLISNMATVLVMIPVAVSAADELDVSAEPVLMAIAVAGSAAFLTPVATPANLMVMEPGGYRFGDYWRLGLPLLVLYGAVAVLLVPLIWAF
jgi:di/tricarboxylate transporter